MQERAHTRRGNPYRRGASSRNRKHTQHVPGIVIALHSYVEACRGLKVLLVQANVSLRRRGGDASMIGERSQLDTVQAVQAVRPGRGFTCESLVRIRDYGNGRTLV